MPALHQPLHGFRISPVPDARVLDHQIVFERNEEPRATGVALASGAASKLVVNAAAFMLLRTDDVEAAPFGHSLAEHDVGSSSGHVRRDGYGAALARLSDNLCFPLILPRVEHLM